MATLDPIPAAESLATIKDRLRASMALFLDDSDFDPLLKKAILALAKNFLKNASDDNIRDAVYYLRGTVLPYILGEDENKNPNE